MRRIGSVILLMGCPGQVFSKLNNHRLFVFGTATARPVQPPVDLCC